MSVLDRADLRARVQTALERFVAQRRPDLLAMGPELAPMADAVQDFLSGGKRLRPAFCFWGHLGAGGADSDALVLAASSLEMFQAAALLHDDVMDGSDTRRGKPSVHRAFEALHTASGWHGSAEVFGRGAAILLGDLCLAWSDEMLVASGLVTPSARTVFDAMRAELSAGQYLDLLEQVRPDTTVETALRVARYKSAKYTIVEPLLLGAGLADVDLTAVYTAYGMPLGVAFQLRDDLLGVFGDPAVTGKPAGDDLREGKRTVLVAMALERASAAQASLVRRELGSPTAAVDDLRQVLVDTGAVEQVEAMISTGCEQALAALAGSSVTADAVAALTDLALAATARQS